MGNQLTTDKQTSESLEPLAYVVFRSQGSG
jgi:hypothetical protein